jgi:small subunit ribosomal protein S6
MSTSRQYELVYIVTPEASEQDVTDLHTQVEQIIERFKGTLDKTENWGRRKLAYVIGKHREGTYVVETITGSGELMKEIDRRLRVSDAVIRHLVVRVDEELRVADRTRTDRQTATARRRVARGLPPERQPGEGRGDADQNDDMEGVEVQR